MSRKLRNTELDSRQSRLKLSSRGKPYYFPVERGVHLGFRKHAKGAGTWMVRRYLGDQKYSETQIGIADDYSDADGLTVLSYWQAVEAARKGMKEHAEKVTAPLTVKQAMEDYLAFKESEGADTYEAKKRIAVHILPKLGSKKVMDLTSQIIRNWHKGLADAPALIRRKNGGPDRFKKLNLDDPEVARKRKSSANRVLTVLKAALNHAFDEEKVPSNAAWGRRVKPFRNVDAARPHYLQVAEAKRLIAATEAEFRPMIHAALLTGARYSEITRLRVRDFNPDIGNVAIQKSKAKKARHIVLTDEGARYFKQVCQGRDGGELMFTREDGSQWRSSQQARPVQAAHKRARIGSPITFNGLRHTWASHSVMNGVPLMVVAKNMGHADTRMVEKHYGHLAPSFITEAIRKGAPRFGRVPENNVVSLR
ncbi:MAG TPA: tyrosine-type recombinase/integrase [Xanthobacteraceae bacterium]|nr:tyrosine-type recombinase/integrase [Xanthobacteraceae bacterium]